MTVDDKEPNEDSECEEVQERLEKSRENVEVRDEYLLRMYEQLWKSISRTESGMWSFIAAYAAISVSILLGIQGRIPVFYASIFSTVISFWGMNIAVDSLKWRNHNLAQVSNIEKELLLEEDIDNIIPKDYLEGENIEWKTYSISGVNFSAFLIALIISIASFLATGPVSMTEYVILYSVFIICYIYTLGHLFDSYGQVRKFICDTKDEDVGPLSSRFVLSLHSIPSVTAIFMLLLIHYGGAEIPPPNIICSGYIISTVILIVIGTMLTKLVRKN